VVLAVSVTSDGRVARIEISTGSGHDLLDRAALQAVKDWLFEPGQRAGRKVAMRVLVPVRFSLR
jgi:protein TonB